MNVHKIADPDAQIQALRRHVAEQCVSIVSSIDTIPPETISREMRDRWLRALRQTGRAVALVEERLGGEGRAEAETPVRGLLG